MQVRQGTLEDITGVMDLIHRVVPRMREEGNLQWDAHYPNPAVFQRDVELGQLWVASAAGIPRRPS